MDNEKLKTWLVVGASSGFGHEICRQLLAKNKNVIAVARRVPDFTDNRALCLSVDATQPQTIRAAIKTAIDKFGHIDALVNCCGLGQWQTFESTTDDEFRKLMDVSFWGYVNTIREVLPLFRVQGHGLIVNISSQSGMCPRIYGTAYCSAKYAIEGLTGALWCETQKFCKVIAVEFGVFPTGMASKDMMRENTFPEYENLPPIPYKIKRHYKNDIALAVSYLINVAQQQNPPRRIILGRDAYDRIKQEVRATLAVLKKSKPFFNVSKKS